MSTYPEHEKMAVAKDASVAEFAEWLLEESRYNLFRYDSAGKTVRLTPRELIAEWLGVDVTKLDEEQDQMIAEVQEMQP